jgi:hypothetical protein
MFQFAQSQFLETPVAVNPDPFVIDEILKGPELIEEAY